MWGYMKLGAAGLDSLAKSVLGTPQQSCANAGLLMLGLQLEQTVCWEGTSIICLKYAQQCLTGSQTLQQDSWTQLVVHGHW